VRSWRASNKVRVAARGSRQKRWSSVTWLASSMIPAESRTCSPSLACFRRTTRCLSRPDFLLGEVRPLTVPFADTLYDQHLETLKSEGLI